MLATTLVWLKTRTVVTGTQPAFRSSVSEGCDSCAQILILVSCPAAPYWTVKPADVRVEEGVDAEVRCEASGDPSPVIVWRRLVGRRSPLVLTI